MKKLYYILKAWIRALGWATTQELATSEYRLKICKKCIHRRSNWFYSFCKLCGCEIFAKSFAERDEDRCPLKKW